AGEFARADRAMIEHASDALGALGRIEDCGDVARLHDVMSLPDDARRRAEIQRVEAELDRMVTLDAAGKYEDVVARAPEISARAEATGFGPVHARALVRWAAILAERDGHRRADELLQLAVAVADRSHDDVTRGRALGERVRIATDHTGNRSAAQQLIAAADAV